MRDWLLNVEAVAVVAVGLIALAIGFLGLVDPAAAGGLYRALGGIAVYLAVWVYALVRLTG